MRIFFFFLTALTILIFEKSNAACEATPLGDVISIEVVTSPAIAGYPVQFKWTYNKSEPAPSGKLTLETPDEVRLDQSNLLVVRTEGAAGIRGTVTAALQVAPTVKQPGTIEITPLFSGEMQVKWKFQTKESCGDKYSSGSVKVFVWPGPPKITDRQISTLTPLTLKKSKNGKYLLKAFTNYYDVIDTETQEVVLSTTGRLPKFSPTARFVLSQSADDEQIEIWDILANTPVFRGAGSIVAFSHADSFALIANTGSGISIVRMLQDVAPETEDLNDTDVDFVGPVERLFIAPERDFSGSDGVFQSERELFLDVANDLIVYRESATTGPDGMTSYEVSEPKAYSLSSAEPISVEEAIVTATLQKMTRGNRDDEKVSWLSDGHISFVWASNGYHIDTLETSLPLPQSNALPKALSSTDRIRATTVGGQPLTRSIVDALKEIDRRLQIEDTSILKAEVLRGKGNVSRQIVAELSKVYNGTGVSFGRGKNFYETVPLPDPKSTLEEPIVIDFSRMGQAIWSWHDGAKRYWLHQTVEAGRRGAGARFSLLSTDGVLTRYTSIDSPSTFRFGDFRSELGNASEIANVSLGSGTLFIVPRPSTSIIVFDITNFRQVCNISHAVNSSDAIQVRIAGSGSALIQENSDHSFYVYTCKNGSLMASGRFLNGEIIVVGANGQFDGAAEAADLLAVRSLGVSERLFLGQYASRLRVSGLLSQTLENGQFPPEPLMPPPQILVSNGSAGEPPTLTVKALSGLASLWLLSNGRIISKRLLSGTEVSIEVDMNFLSNHETVSAVAFDNQGLASAPKLLPAAPGRETPKGKLIARTLGIDTYEDKSISNLRFASSDAVRVLRALERARGYSDLDAKQIDSMSTPQEILSNVRDAILLAGERDTVVLSFAGHGYKMANGDLILITNKTDMQKVGETGLMWREIARLLKDARGRVVVLLDVCHSGSSAPGFADTNEAAIDALTSQGGGSIIVFSASRGRQFSRESAQERGGYFSIAFSNILEHRQDYDFNRDGLIQSNELSAGLSKEVIAGTKGLQNPEVSRNELFGDFSLF